MFRFIKKNRFRISIVIILIYFLYTLVAQVEKPRSDNWFPAFVQSVAYPFQTIYHLISTHITEAWNHYIWLIDVREENKKLYKKLLEYKTESTKTKEIQIAYHRLLNSLRFKRTNNDQKIFAEVIGEVKNGFSRLIIVNKGSDDGIKKNYSVVSHDGIIGKIQSVTSFQASVQLVTDSHSRFPVLIQRTRTKAFLQGVDGTLKIEQVPQRVELEHGDKIITSGLAGIFPKGFPVGTIETIDKKRFDLLQSATIKPAVDFSKLEEIAVILRAVNNIHQPLFTESDQ